MMIGFRTLSTLAVAACAGVYAVAPAHADVLPQGVRARATGQVVMYDSSGGATTRARTATVDKNFTAETGVSVRMDFNSDVTKFFAAMENGGSIPWSMVEFPTKGDFLRARDAGYLVKLDPSIVDLAKVEPGAHDEYGIDVMRYGIVLTYNTEKFSGDAAPKRMSDLFDVKRFPGKRCLFKYPQFGGVLESALLASGVPRDKLYPLDLDKAFAELDKIKSDILWWSNGDEAIRLLSSGDCSIGIAWSGRVFSAAKNDKAPLALVWQDSLYSQAVYAIPKGAPNAAGGQVMLAHFIADLPGQKDLVAQITYATPLIALTVADYGPELAPWIVAGDNARKAIEENASYYSKNLPQIVDRFNRWVAQN